jgi:hypothetical protein
MRLTRLETTGLRGLRDGVYEVQPDRSGPGHITMVTGPPQAGLTTLLDAVALTVARLAPGGAAADPAEVVRAGETMARIRSTWWLDAEERAFGGLIDETTDAEVVFQRGGLGRAQADPALLGVLSRYDHSPALAKVVSIPARRVTDGGVPALGDFESDQRFKRVSSDPGKFAGAAHALIRHAAGLDDHARFDAAAGLFAQLCDTVRLVGVTPTGHLDFALPSGAGLRLHQLGFGERNAFVLAVVPVLLGLQRSVVLLDTPELGLAPGVAARWLGVLRSAMPDAQWIVASRDPAVVSSVEAAARIELSRPPNPWRPP